MDLLHFNSPAQAIHYFALCLISIVGVIQLAAARSNRSDLLWFDARTSFFFGTASIPAAFAWFFLTDEEIFMPGLAGGEIIAIFLAAFVSAMTLSRVMAFFLARARLYTLPSRIASAKEPTL